MGRRYSLDLRERVIAAVEAGSSSRAAARQFSPPSGYLLATIFATIFSKTLVVKRS